MKHSALFDQHMSSCMLHNPKPLSNGTTRKAWVFRSFTVFIRVLFCFWRIACLRYVTTAAFIPFYISLSCEHLLKNWSKAVKKWTSLILVITRCLGLSEREPETKSGSVSSPNLLTFALTILRSCSYSTGNHSNFWYASVEVLFWTLCIPIESKHIQKVTRRLDTLLWGYFLLPVLQRYVVLPSCMPPVALFSGCFWNLFTVPLLNTTFSGTRNFRNLQKSSFPRQACRKVVRHTSFTNLVFRCKYTTRTNRNISELSTTTQDIAQSSRTNKMARSYFARTNHWKVSFLKKLFML